MAADSEHMRATSTQAKAIARRLLPRRSKARRQPVTAEPAPAAPRAPAAQPTLEQQAEFFRAFGVLKVPGLFAAEIEQISDAFDETFRDHEFEEVDPKVSLHKVVDPEYGTARRVMKEVIEFNDKLKWIKHDPRITQLAQALLGDGYEYVGSAGNIFNSFIYWHTDWFRNEVAPEIHLKFAFYLDELDAQSGALRVMPGTSHFGEYRTLLYDEGRVADPGCLEGVFGMPESELPYWALSSHPGDVVVMDHRILHSNFEGGPHRRMFSLQYNQARAS